MRRLLLVSLLFCSVKNFAQYKGGSNDGTSLAESINQNTLPAIYSGGINDGVALNVVTNQNPITNIYTGGINDGVAISTTLNSNPLPSIYSGGINDGVALDIVTNQNPITNIYTGGINDGVALDVVTNQNPIANIYTGGINDGVAFSNSVNNNPLPAIYAGGINDGYAITVALGQNPSIPLPITLLYFTGAWANHDAIISWETGIETNLDHFELERSDDAGSSFNMISSIMPNGPTNAHIYSYADSKAYNLPANYFLYRLKAVDKNGGFKYSAVVRLAKDKTAPVIIAYPNPTTGQFTLTLGNTPDLNGYSYVLSSTEGRIIKRELIRQNSTLFNLGNLPSAIYHLSIYKNRDLLQHFAIVLSH
jgi:hypothetical protein